MAIGTSGLTHAFKEELLKGSFGNLSSGNSTNLRVALIKDSTGLDAVNSDTSTHPTVANMDLYGNLGEFEVTGTGNYNRNHADNDLEGADVTFDDQTGTAILSFNNIVFSNVTLSTSGALIYRVDNSASNRHTVALISFNGTVSANSGNLTLTFPTATATSGFIRLV